MPKKRHKPEEIVAKLRQVDVLTSQGQSVADAVRSIGVTEVTYYQWRQEYGGLKFDQGGVRRAMPFGAQIAHDRTLVAHAFMAVSHQRESPRSESTAIVVRPANVRTSTRPLNAGADAP